MHPGSPLAVDKIVFQWPSRLLDISPGTWSIETTALHFFCIHSLPAVEDQNPLFGKSAMGTSPTCSPLTPSWFWNLSFPTSFSTDLKYQLMIPTVHIFKSPVFCSMKSILLSQQGLVLPVFLQSQCKLFLSVSIIETATTWMEHLHDHHRLSCNTPVILPQNIVVGCSPGQYLSCSIYFRSVIFFFQSLLWNWNWA